MEQSEWQAIAAQREAEAIYRQQADRDRSQDADRETRSQGASQVDDAQAAPVVDTNPDIPAEIAELRDLAATAASNLAMADGDKEAAAAELAAAWAKAQAAGRACEDAAVAEDQARHDYIAALRRHGYVQTADGPKPGAL